MKIKNQLGRSMVEMLGVLAIIGILSASALSGYSKAMMQLKLNKHTDEISYLMATAIFNNDKLNKASFNMFEELKALGAFTWNVIPNKKVTDDNSTEKITFQDSLHNTIWFEHYSQDQMKAIGIILPQSDFTQKVCYNYINIFKNFSDEIYRIHARKDVGNQMSWKMFYGKNVCDGNTKKCLEHITVDEITNMCKTQCDGADECRLYAVWY